MDEGRIHAEGSPAELIDRFAAPDVLEVTGPDADALEHVAVDSLVQHRERHGNVLYIYNADNRALLHRLGELGLEPVRHMARQATLEDVFLNITGRELAE
jgi:lipooligosaccharide transport system ATP-binding protein